MEVTIDLSSDLRITLNGDLSSIGEAIKKLGNDQIKSIKIEEYVRIPHTGKKTRLRGLRKEVLILRREGYFSTQRTSKEVENELNNKGMEYSSLSVCSCLSKLTKEKKFKKESFPAGPSGGRFHTFTSTYSPKSTEEKVEKVDRRDKGEISSVLNDLLKEGFFRSAKNKHEVREEFQRKGISVLLSSISSALKRMINRKELQKEESGGRGRGSLATFIDKKHPLFY